MFHYKPSSHWGAPIYGNLPWWETAPCITHGYEERHLRAPTRGISDGMWPSVIDPEYCGHEEFSDEKSWICSVRVWIFTSYIDIMLHVVRWRLETGGSERSTRRVGEEWRFLSRHGGSQSHPKSPVSNGFRPHVNTNKVCWLGFRFKVYSD
jgi:hypothetical protein